MKRIVRRSATSAYLSAAGEWVTDFRSAHDFENLESAVFDVENRHLEDTEFVLVKGSEPVPVVDPYLTIS